MKNIFRSLGIFVLALVFQSCTSTNDVHVSSPNGKFRFELLTEDSQLYYRAFFDGKEIIGKSILGFELSDTSNITQNLEINEVKESKVATDWKPVYGEKNMYPDQYHQSVVTFSSKDQKTPLFQLNIRAYNEGLAFQYEFENAGQLTLNAELTEFALPANSEVWVSEQAQGAINKTKLTEISNKIVERPLLAELNDSLFVALGEAALVDFARMKFELSKDKPTALVASLEGQVQFDGPFTSPWRTIMAGNSPGEILENNYLLLNLNAPNAIKNSDWIKPGKVIREVTLTTDGGMACVDFAVKHNLQYIEFDAGWYGNEYDDASDATTITVDPNRSKGPLDLKRVIKYAESKGIGVILYVNRRALEKQLDEVLPLLKSWGVKGIKYGFVNVGPQEWTSWLHEAVRKAADHGLMIDIHDEYRPTGYSRTYPNLMTQEGIRGDEESPDNTTVLKTLFTRMLAGAGDHTNCYFAERVDNKMGSHASQLAKAVMIYSPWQFLYWYDRPENSPGAHKGAGNSTNYILEVPELTFFDEMPTVWDDTKVLSGYPGEHAVVARKSGDTWFVGALNGYQERDNEISFDFLNPNKTYTATIYTDDDEVKTHSRVALETRSLSSKDLMQFKLGKHKGMAMVIKPAK
ncbi:glycoside hydrolase family 97 N-terminal domain-containing protein [Cyclobacterium sp. 1_MG-2023]|uniref:glycoside hydrolase family 97 protein n=1 Tax=Cyclobacterium sp. 1_MG-2023 TaxID=3062681 RepID=UPI0026E317C4|nr:glycoside hydrolase family 97 protein [Cyclobacterium sp. 1_MG-2023]MDO6438141.1 glycoside hydrolase family 97 N-terminal domain-containing protein [Cyclobacterium sp. 1_MG-2023]